VSLSQVLSVLLGAVFVCSGAAKVFSPSWPIQARTLGVPPWLVRALPVVELVVGAAAMAGLARRVSVAVLGAMLVVFTGAIVRALRGGAPPPCACFGRWSERPLSWRTVARNAALLGLAAAALVT
jgi:uncharacterized membrane protein YphA (DoxX/SURF4 family)